VLAQDHAVGLLRFLQPVAVLSEQRLFLCTRQFALRWGTFLRGLRFDQT
jgi:hypothetical protein